MAEGGFQFIFLDPLIDSEATVLSIRAHALKLYRDGKTIMEWSGEGPSTTRQFTAPIESILMETRRCLKLINPNKYGHIVRQSTMRRFG